MIPFVAKLSVTQVAERLGVSVGRVHHRITDGSLPAERVGSAWIIDEASLVPLLDGSKAGRPLSRRSAWAVLAQTWSEYDNFLDTLAASERSRAARRLSKLMRAATAQTPEDQVALMRWTLRNRADRKTFRASTRDLIDVGEDKRLLISGVAHPDSQIASGALVEGYLGSDALDAFVDDYLLVAASERDANVFLHIAPVRPPSAAPLLIAADLVDHRSPREESRATDILAEVALSTRWRHWLWEKN